MFKPLSGGLAALCVATLAAGTAHATPIGFNGYYDYSTWTSAETYGVPTVSTISADRQTLTLYEPNAPDNPVAVDNPQEFTFSHAVEAGGTVSFDWVFDQGDDTCCAGFNFYVNGTRYSLAGGNFDSPFGWSGPHVSGSFSTAVQAGDIIAFAAFSVDARGGSTLDTITNFFAPTAANPGGPGGTVPEPGTLALVGLGLAGIGRLRRRAR